MNYTDVLNALKEASLFDLFRLGVAISHEAENPARINAVRQAFKEGDTISYFDEQTNALRSAVVIQKHIKYVSILDTEGQYFCKITYFLLNLDKADISIHANRHEKLSKNHASIGDCVGFNKDGEQIAGVITRLNHKTVSLITADRRRWRVAYQFLYKIIDADLAQRFAELKVSGIK